MDRGAGSRVVAYRGLAGTADGSQGWHRPLPYVHRPPRKIKIPVARYPGRTLEFPPLRAGNAWFLSLWGLVSPQEEK